MKILTGFSKYYGPLFDADSGGGSGNSDQTDWRAKYDTLNAKIANGEYVAKESYVTLQRNLEAAVNERKTLQTQFDAASAKVSLLTEDMGKFQKQITELQGTVSTKDTEIAGLSTKLQRDATIFQKFPDLAPFAADIREPKDGETFEDVLTAFKTRLSGIQANARTDYKAGATAQPEKAIGDGNKNAQSLFQEALVLQKSGDLKGYQAKMNEYHAQKATETKAS